MDIQIIQTDAITAYVGVRAASTMAELGYNVKRAFAELAERRHEIKNIKNPLVTYGITPPNYKGNNGQVDFYCCYEVEPLANVPHGMVHIHLLPRMYSVTDYIGPASESFSAYDFTSSWLLENGYSYDDIDYYLERYDELKAGEAGHEQTEIKIYCPVKKRETALQENTARP